jgi:NAD(P)-dependent dehydrogenase (short-subunit alcohol dehydrogenase family)
MAASAFKIPSSESLQKWATGKVALVTGGALGIGFAVAQLFTSAGAKVVIADIDEKIGKESEKKLGENALFVRCDVTSWADQVNLFKVVASTFKRIDLVVCNAGINPELVPSNGKRYDFLADEYDPANPELLLPPATKIYEVNVFGILYSLRLAMREMVANKNGGRIVVMGSTASYQGYDDHALYCSSKHALLGLFRATALRKECIDNEISISLVAPSVTRTRMTQAFIDHLPVEIPVSSPGDIASAVAIFATEPVEKVRGKSLWVQGQTYTEAEDIVQECQNKLLI